LSTNYISGIQASDANNIFIAGSYKGTIDFDPNTTENIMTSFYNDKFEGYIQNLNQNGDLLWV